MTLRRIYAQLSCSNLEQSISWFKILFGRIPDSRPMTGLAEWHHGDSAGFQLFDNPSDAGHGTLTLIVESLVDEKIRLQSAGLTLGQIEPADYVTLVRLYDPDDNLVVMAQQH